MRLEPPKAHEPTGDDGRADRPCAKTGIPKAADRPRTGAPRRAAVRLGHRHDGSRLRAGLDQRWQRSAADDLPSARRCVVAACFRNFRRTLSLACGAHRQRLIAGLVITRASITAGARNQPSRRVRDHLYRCLCEGNHLRYLVLAVGLGASADPGTQATYTLPRRRLRARRGWCRLRCHRLLRDLRRRRSVAFECRLLRAVCPSIPADRHALSACRSGHGR